MQIWRDPSGKCALKDTNPLTNNSCIHLIWPYVLVGGDTAQDRRTRTEQVCGRRLHSCGSPAQLPENVPNRVRLISTRTWFPPLLNVDPVLELLCRPSPFLSFSCPLPPAQLPAVSLVQGGFRSPEMSLSASIVPAFVTPSAFSFSLRPPPWQQQHHGDRTPSWSQVPIGQFSARPRSLQDSAARPAFGGAATGKGSVAFNKRRNIRMQVLKLVRGGMVPVCTLVLLFVDRAIGEGYSCCCCRPFSFSLP